jgi:serine/threonine protein kinase
VNHDTDSLQEAGSPYFPPSIDCLAVEGMFVLGARRLTEEALDELAKHFELCDACGAKFVGGVPESPSSKPPSVNLTSRLVQEVLDRVKERPQCESLRLIAGQGLVAHPETLSDFDGQLAPGQRLQGKSRLFVVEERIGYGEFTETYAARQVSEDGIDGRDLGRRAVIKIPRVAEDMSSDAAMERLHLLRSLIQVHAQQLQNLAGLPEVAGIVDCGEYVHWLRDRSTASTFVAYEFVEGLELATYMAEHHCPTEQFCGLSKAADFAHWARMLAKGVLHIHNRLLLHGDICPRNILVTPDGHAVFVDVGESLFREVMNGAKAFSGNFYRAPEGIGTPSSDLFSLGGVLYFLATGKQPIGFGHNDKETLKREITFKIKEANPRLYQDDAGVADVIAMCLRRRDRIQHASQLLRDIDTFWPTPASILDELKSLDDPAATLDASGCSMYLSTARSYIRSLHQILTDMSKGVFDANGGARDIRSDAYALLSTLGVGDEFITVSLPAFWYPDNIGINGRFLSMCRNAAARGASIKRVFLIDERLSDPHLQQIVAAQLEAVADIEPSLRPNFAVRYVLMSADERRRRVANGRHFGLLAKGNECIAMSPEYDSNDLLVSLRFRSGPRQVDGLREAFEDIWSNSRPLVDLCFPTDSLTLDMLDKTG